MRGQHGALGATSLCAGRCPRGRGAPSPPLAAGGLTLVMLLAVGFNLGRGSFDWAGANALPSLAAALFGYGRRKIRPIQPRASGSPRAPEPSGAGGPATRGEAGAVSVTVDGVRGTFPTNRGATWRRHLQFREAEIADLGAIVELLADDDLGAAREAPAAGPGDAHRKAFLEIAADPNNELIVVCSGAEVVGTFQLTYIPNLTFQGGRRAQIEGVRVKRSARGRGIGAQMLRWAIQRARERGCRLIQLTSNKQRGEAIRFYESLGFHSSHEGMKLDLAEPAADDPG